MKNTYTYNGTTYTSEKALRNAVWQHERKVFGNELPECVTVTESEDEGESLTLAKARRKASLDTAYRQWTEKDATLVSSLGFTSRADRTSLMDLWILSLNGKGTESYRDADGDNHPLSPDDITHLLGEMAEAQVSFMYERMRLDKAIDDADTSVSLSSIDIAFSPWESKEGEED